MKPKGIIVYNDETGEMVYHARDLNDLVDIVGAEWIPRPDEILINIESLKPPAN